MSIDWHMDFNPTEKAAKRKKNKSDNHNRDHLTFLGINEVDHGAEVEKNYQESLKLYPTPKTCTDLAGVLESIRNHISTQEEKRVRTMSSGGSGRVEARWIEALTKRYNELFTLSNQWRCQQAAEQQAHQQYLNDFNNQLQAASELGEEDQTSKYLVIGGVGFVALLSLLIIFR